MWKPQKQKSYQIFPSSSKSIHYLGKLTGDYFVCRLSFEHILVKTQCSVAWSRSQCLSSPSVYFGCFRNEYTTLTIILCNRLKGEAQSLRRQRGKQTRGTQHNKRPKMVNTKVSHIHSLLFVLWGI